jgi:hypothetical protein
MGRTKSDSPLKFPWDKIFSEDERQLDNAIEYCKSNSSGSENLKRAVTAIGYGYNSGSKSVLCERIKEKAKQIRFQLEKVEDDANREVLREQVIHFYRQTYLKKFEGKEEGIDRIAIPERPELPFLDEREKTMFNASSPPSSPRGGSKEVKKTIIIEEDDEEEELSNEEKILRAEVILYFKNAPVIGGKRSINGKDLYDNLSNKYTHPSILNKDNVKRQIREVSNVFNKLTKSQIQEAERLISKGKKEEKKKPVIIEEEEEEYEIKRPSPPIKLPPIKLPPIKLPPSAKGLSELEVLNFIRKKGWPEPLIQSKESLCDYVLRKIREEDEKSEGDYHSLRDDIERLSNNLIALTEMYENRLNEIEKIQKQQKKKKSVTWGKDEIRVFESEKEEIKEQIEEIKEQLTDAKEREKEAHEVVEEKRQMCFRMRDWIDSDDFDRVEVEKDLLCDNGNVCNVENGVCESGMTSMDEYAELGISKIKGKKDTVDRLNKKFNKKKVMIIEEDEEEPGSERELPTIKEIKPIVKQIILRNKDNLENIKIKDIMSELNIHFKIDLSEMKNEIKPIAKKEVNKMIALIEKEKVAIEEPILREEPIEMVDEIKVPIVKECNKISFDEDVSDEVRAKDLMCDEGEVCDLDTSRCIPEIEAMDPVEELTIGGVLLKVTGKNKIVQALKEKIARAGGEIVIPVVEEEPVVEEPLTEVASREPLTEVVPHEPLTEVVPHEPLEEKKEEVIEVPSEVAPRGKSLSELVEESKANDVFASNIPGKRPTLQEIVNGIKSITRETPVVTAQTKIRVAEKRCIDRIAMCAGIKLM